MVDDEIDPILADAGSQRISSNRALLERHRVSPDLDPGGNRFLERARFASPGIEGCIFCQEYRRRNAGLDHLLGEPSHFGGATTVRGIPGFNDEHLSHFRPLQNFGCAFGRRGIRRPEGLRLFF
jgi:hypothetical protein